MISLISQSIFVLICLVLEISSSPVVCGSSDNLSNFTSNPDYKTIWQEYKLKYNRKCKDLREEFDEFSNFENNVAAVKSHNAKYDSKQSTYFCRINENSYLDAPTWINKTSGFRAAPLSDSDSSTIPNNNRRRKRSTPPASLDYQASGLTMPVKNQGDCGSCYSFAAVAAIEGQAIKKSNLRADLSVQQVVDCSGSHGNYGCNGGSTTMSFKYVKDAGGIKSYASYPYAEWQNACQTNGTALVQINGGTRYTYTTVSDLKGILAATGPVAVAVNALDSLHLYGGGIYSEPKCGTKTMLDQLNHAVLLVGYGSYNGINYWKLKNSWGTSWGEQGYIRISQTYDCGVTSDVNAPI